MIKPLIPINEKTRIEALKSYQILDTGAEAHFDAITKMAALICDVPICLISLVDENRQWFKSTVGLSVSETPRDISFCGHAINQTEIYYVEDARLDKRFQNNPLVTGEPNVLFYAGKPLIDQAGNSIGTLCVIDHKPRKLSQTQLEQLKMLGEQAIYLIELRQSIKIKNESFSLLNKLAENLPGFIYTFQMFSDGRTSFPYSSNLIEEIYELTSKEVRMDASKVFSRIHPEDLASVTKSIQDSALNMSKWSHDYRLILPERGEKWVRGNANPERAGDGSILWHGYISDITELKKHEIVINHALKMASLGEMASGIAHEINNPLAIIKLASQQLSTTINRKDFSAEKLTKYANKISDTTDRIAKIIKGLGFFSRNANGTQIKNESIYNIIEDTMSFCAEKFKINNVTLAIKFSPNIHSIYIDCRAVEISQVLLNLMNNAFDAIEGHEKKWVELEFIDQGESVAITITDCGPGIKKEDVDKILAPFYTTKIAGKGTGLGLSISQRIIEAHKGKLWIDTNSLHTKFVIEIPKVFLHSMAVA
ncbi:MAG: ATP-binding protein [Bacteriovorax sp.]|nr:ATP-binding protein [Bacteriovorax sp.]